MTLRDGFGGGDTPPIPAYALRALSLVSDFKRSLSVRAHTATRADTIDIGYLNHLKALYKAVTFADDYYRAELGYPESESMPDWVEGRGRAD